MLALLLIPAISRGGVEDRVRPVLAVRKADDSLLATYTVENVSGATLRFFYNDGQQYDFALSGGGREIWRWSAGMAFTEAEWEDSLAAGASVVVEGQLPWPEGRESLGLTRQRPRTPLLTRAQEVLPAEVAAPVAGNS